MKKLDAVATIDETAMVYQASQHGAGDAKFLELYQATFFTVGVAIK